MSNEAVQEYRKRQTALKRKQRTLYATDKEFKAIKELLRRNRQ